MRLINNRGYAWEQSGDLHFKGYRYTDSPSNGIQHLAERFRGKRTIGELSTVIKEWNGCFALVLDTEEFLFAAVDFIRSIPLFYRLDDKLELSDTAAQLLQGGLTIDEVAAAELLVSGITWGNRTLSEEIHGLGNGECLFYDKQRGMLEVLEYRNLSYEEKYSGSPEEWAKDLYKVYTKAASRFVQDIQGRTIVIPLSGGEDSRLVVHALHEIGYEKVICYSYGKRGNFEGEISKKIADYLGYPWYFLEYDDLDWRAWYESEEFQDFSDYASNLVSIPHFQDFHAVKALVQEGRIPEDAIFAPGHTGDLLHGNHIPKLFLLRDQISKERLITENLRELAGNAKWTAQVNSHRALMIQDMTKLLPPGGQYPREKACELLEYYDWKEKHGKFLANSIRVYEYFGHPWRMLLWDKEVVDFWMRVPIEYRYERNLHYIYTKAFQQPLRDAIGAGPSRAPKLDLKYELKDVVRLLSSELFRSLVARRKNRELKGSYDTHIHRWYQILSKEEFDSLSDRALNINGIVAIKHLERLRAHQHKGLSGANTRTGGRE